MMRIRETHPAKPGGAVIEASEPLHRQIRDPIGMVEGRRNGVVLRFGSTGVATTFGKEETGETIHVFGMVVDQPAPVMRQGDHPIRTVVEAGHGYRRSVHGLYRAIESPPGTCVTPPGPVVLLPLSSQVETRFEVGLAQQRGVIAAVVAEVGGYAGSVDRQRYAIGDHSVGTRVLTGENGRPGRHADGVLVVGPLVVHATGGQGVDDRRAGHGSAVAAERVIPLLITGDEQDVAGHGSFLQLGSRTYPHDGRDIASPFTEFAACRLSNKRQPTGLSSDRPVHRVDAESDRIGASSTQARHGRRFSGKSRRILPRTALVPRLTAAREKAQVPLQMVSGLLSSRKNTGLRAYLSQNVLKPAATSAAGSGFREKIQP